MDFKQISDEFAQAKIIGVGESTHGTHEFFIAKSELFKRLVKENGLNALLFEDGIKQCSAINEYISSGKGNLKELVLRFYPVWRNQEVIQLLQWMRDNFSQYPVNFVGFDTDQSIIDASKRDEYMAQNITTYVNENPNQKILIWAHNSHIKVSSEVEKFHTMGMFLKQEFGNNYCAIAQFFGIGEFSAAHIDENHPESIDRTLKPVHISNIPEKLLENRLNKLSKHAYFLSKNEFNNKGLLRDSASVRSIGWGVVPSRIDEYVENCNLEQEFDGLIFYPKTTASHLMY